MRNLTLGAACLVMVGIAAFSVPATHAQTAADAPDPADDLELIRTKASTDPSLAELLSQLENMRSRAEPTNPILRQMLREASGDGEALTKPFAYAIAAQVRVAQSRAQYISQILQADLDNDGDVTKSELKASLPLSRNSEAAAAFFSSDADENEIVSAQEIRMAAEAWVGSANRDGRNRGRIFELFDFDTDGVLSPEELNRGIAALGN